MEDRRLYDNLCKKSLSHDTRGIYTRRREQLNPWFPEAGALHINGIGLFRAKSWTIEFTNTERETRVLNVLPSTYGIVYSIVELTKGLLSYQDILIVLSEEFTKLFKFISNDFGDLRDYPEIVEEKIYPNVLYKGCGFYFFNEKQRVGFKLQGMDEFFTVVCRDTSYNYSLLVYVALSLGYYFTKEGVLKS